MPERNKWIALALLMTTCVVLLVPFALRSAEHTPSPGATSLVHLPAEYAQDTGLMDSETETHDPVGATLLPAGRSGPAASNGAVDASYGSPATPAMPGSASPPEEPAQAIIDLAHRNIQDNARALQSLCGDAVASLRTGDFDAILDLYSPDEIVVDPLGKDWPELDSTSTLPTVNVFLAKDVPVYFTYALATWTDAGITSQHTVCVPMRFIDGSWYLTGIDATTDGLVFVTSVTL